ncbi:MAG TPA: AHH domain-containing protein [Vicinamibacterales bacterium]|nr:AHH domain-containing protein [Vicinamibacterales bacterium]
MAKKKKGTKGKHSQFRDTFAEHKPVGAYEGGGCLTGHQSAWKENDSCSYRWQGIQNAKDKNAKVYNIKSEPDWHLDAIANTFRWIPVKSINAGRAGQIVQRLKKGIKKGKLKQKIQAKNFTTGYTPYSNQVHHVIPNNVLKEAILKATKKKADLVKDLVDGLLAAPYNINYKVNMLILPSLDSVCCKLGLPKHLGSHPTYDKNLKDKVNETVQMYTETADDKEEHDPDFGKIADELVAISEDLYDSVVDYGQSKIKAQCAVGTVNTLPKRVFNVLNG